MIAFDSCRAHVYFNVKISNFGNDPLNMVMIKHVSGDPTRKNLLYMKTVDPKCFVCQQILNFGVTVRKLVFTD